jgi:tRNA(Ile)-lysidine synthase
MRLKRGSGVFGLAAMRPVVMAGDIAVVRPLLNVPRTRLAATTAAAGLSPAVDPMNADPRFDRARMRNLLPLIAAEGIDPADFAATAGRLADAADAIDAAATALLGMVDADGFAVGWLKPEVLAAVPREVRLRALVRLLLAVGGDDYPPRHERLVTLADAIAAHRSGRFKRTLAGCVIEWRSGRFAFYREVGRNGLPFVQLAKGRALVWDHRFAIAAGRGSVSALSVGALGEDGRRELRIAATTHPAGALAALPAIRRAGRIVAVPPLSGDAGDSFQVRSLLAERLARPPLFPDLAALP